METLSRANLPDDIDALKGMVVNQGYVIEKLRAQIAVLRRHQFGSKSETLDQLELLLDDMEARQAALTEIVEAPASDDETKEQPKRKSLPDHLPREEHRHRLEKTDCASCGAPMRKMAEDTREILDYVPGSFVVKRHICEKYACRDCGTIAEAPLPSMPIEKGAPGAGLLAHVLISKYCDHLPLYRQSEIYAREGVEIPRSTMAGWIGKMSNLLAPVAERIERHVLAGAAIHTDDTPIPVLDPGRGKTKTGRLWAHVRDERPHGSETPAAAFYKYSADRKGMRPREYLQDYSGYLHADGYAGYDKLYGEKIKEVACMAHVRRKFFDIHKATSSPIAEEALKRIAALYEIEKRIRGKPPDERACVRQDDAKEKFEALHDWLQTTLPSVPGRGDLAKAMRYAIARMKRMKIYLQDGRLEIDNNIAERSVRGVAVGKKNYLFAGSDAGGESAAVIYTLVETAKLNGVEPHAWLTHVIANIADHPMKKINDLMPWKFAPCAS